MKTIYFLFAIVLSGLWISCYDDKGNYDYSILNQAEVTGIDSIYRCDLLSHLVITPKLNSQDKSRTYDYMWLCYKNTKDGIDTLSCEKDLDYELTLDPAIYTLVFAYQDRETAVTKYVFSKLVVESEYSRGWYVLKEKNGYTDLDFFSSTFEAADLMDKVHGQPLVGRPRGMGLIEDYNWFNEESGELEQWNMCLSLLTEQDLKVMRISDLKLLGEFNSLFYEQPAACVPEKWFGWDGANALINDGRIYTINIRVGTLGSAKFAYEKTGDYHLSNIMTKKSQLCPLLFDEKVGMFCTVTENGADIIYLESDSQSKFPDAYPDYNLIYAGLLDEGGLWDPGKGYAVMEHKTDKSRMVLHFDLLCLDKDWGGDDAFKNRIIEQDKIVSTSNLSSATCFGMNRISKMLYFSKEDKLYYYDLENKREFEVKRLNGETAVPAGEHIVMIKHVVFNCSYPEEAIEEYLSKLAVATSDGTDYKIYLFDIVSDKLQTEPTVFAGNGIPAEIIYMSSYMGNAYWCY